MLLAVGLGLAVLCALALAAWADRRRAAAAASAAAAAAEPAGGALFGRVWRLDGVVLPDTVLTILGEDGREIARTHADAAGDYRVELGDPGRYLVIASHAVYHPHADEVQVDGDPTELGLVLPDRRIALEARLIPAPAPAPQSESHR